MCERDIGTIGEEEFASLASKANLVGNKAATDKKGWDYVIEGNLKSDKNLPSDMDDSQLFCKVQVKSTDHQRRRWQIKMSNLKLLSTATMPCFICFQEYDKQDDVQTIFLLHFDETLITRVLKEVRRLDNAGEGDRLHKHHLYINYGYEQKLRNTSPATLKNAISDFITNGMTAYVENKLKIIRSVGFENGSAEIKFQTSGEAPLEIMHNFLLGRRESIDIKNVEMRHKRFSEVTDTPFEEFKEGIMKLAPNFSGEKCKVLFRSSPLEPALIFNALLKASPANAALASHEHAYLLTSSFFEIAFGVRKEQTEFTFNPNPDSEQSLSSLNKFLRLLVLFNKGRVIFMEIRFTDRPSIANEFSLPEAGQDLNELRTTVKEAISICSKFEIDADELVTTADDLMAFNGNTHLLHWLLFEDFNDIGLTSNMSVDGQQPDVITNIAVLTYQKTRLGSSTLIAIAVLTGDFTLVEENLYRLENCVKSIEDTLVLEEQNSDLKSKATKRFEEIKSSYIKEGFQVTKLFFGFSGIESKVSIS